MHNALLTLNFLNANEKGTTAVERHWIVERNTELNQSVYFKDVLTSEWNQDMCYIEEGVLLLFLKEKKSYASKLIKIRFE